MSHSQCNVSWFLIKLHFSYFIKVLYFSKKAHNSVDSTYTIFQIMYTSMYISCTYLFKECTQLIKECIQFCIFNIHNFQKIHTILYIQHTQSFNEHTQFFTFNVQFFFFWKVNNFSKKKCIQFCIFNVHNISKNAHSCVYLTYTIQKMYTNLYIQHTNFSKNCTWFFKKYTQFCTIMYTIFQTIYTFLYIQSTWVFKNRTKFGTYYVHIFL